MVEASAGLACAADTQRCGCTPTWAVHAVACGCSTIASSIKTAAQLASKRLQPHGAMLRGWLPMGQCRSLWPMRLQGVVEAVDPVRTTIIDDNSNPSEAAA